MVTLKCELCGEETTLVIDTRQYETYIRRRHLCKTCGGKFTTYQVYGTLYNLMVEQIERLQSIVQIVTSVIDDARGGTDASHTMD